MEGILSLVWFRVWQIFGYSNIFLYEYSFVSYSYHFFDTNIFGYSLFVSFFLIQIYSDIRSYCFSDTNIFGYSFVLLFWYEYIRIFVRIIFLIRIYSDIRSYRFFDKNIFEYSFVSKIYIRHTLTQTCRDIWCFQCINKIDTTLGGTLFGCLFDHLLLGLRWKPPHTPLCGFSRPGQSSVIF